jgi:hypothetical protein
MRPSSGWKSYYTVSYTRRPHYISQPPEKARMFCIEVMLSREGVSMIFNGTCKINSTDLSVYFIMKWTEN